MERVHVRGAEIAAEQVGTGPVDLVLVHGFQNDRTAWLPVVDRVDLDRFRVTTFDLVGCGASSAAREWARCTIDEYAADLLALCNALAVASPVVIGHSLGAAAAIQAAMEAPGRFAGLVAVAPASTTGLDFVSDDDFATLAHPTVEQQRTLAYAAFHRPLPPDEFDALMRVIATATPEHIEGAARSMRGFHRAAELGTLSLPALLVCGDRDRHVPLRKHLVTQQGIPRCGLQVYFDVGHVPFVEVPDRFADDIQRFIHTVEQRRAQAST